MTKGLAADCLSESRSARHRAALSRPKKGRIKVTQVTLLTVPCVFDSP